MPQIGWNTISPLPGKKWDDTPFKNIKDQTYLYFVHSFFIDPVEDVGVTLTNYDGLEYVSSIQKDNIFACQFHPEKSGEIGLDIYNQWALQNNLK